MLDTSFKTPRELQTELGKRFRVRAITTTVAEANAFMERHDETALIACFGPFNVIANKYEGVQAQSQDTFTRGGNEQ